jgi:hypothetical protein
MPCVTARAETTISTARSSGDSLACTECAFASGKGDCPNLSNAPARDDGSHVTILTRCPLFRTRLQLDRACSSPRDGDRRIQVSCHDHPDKLHCFPESCPAHTTAGRRCDLLVAHPFAARSCISLIYASRTLPRHAVDDRVRAESVSFSGLVIIEKTKGQIRHL